MRVAVALLVLTAGSVALRTGALDAGFWIDEAIAVGIASHEPGEIPALLRQDGSPPLYYLLLHGWMALVGDGEAATRSLSLVFAAVAVPAAWWAGGRPGGRGAWRSARSSPTTRRRRGCTRSWLSSRWSPRRRSCGGVRSVLVVALTLLLYTHTWGVFLFAAFALVWLVRDRGRGGLLVGVAVAVLYLPWVPSLVFQALHTGAPWSHRPSVLYLVPAALAVAWRPRDELVLVGAAGLALAWLASQFEPAWSPRYLFVLFGPVLVVLARRPAWAVAAPAVLAAALLLAGPPAAKSNARAVATSVAQSVRAGDLVVCTQPEQVPVLQRYLPAGIRYLTPLGTPADPSYTDWRDALPRLRAARAERVLAPRLGELTAGRRVVLIVPVARRARSPWSLAVQRRTREWRAALRADPRLRSLGRYVAARPGALPQHGPRRALRGPTLTEVSEERRNAAERFIAERLEDPRSAGRPISERARASQRSLEHYLKAGVRPRWMDRLIEIEHGTERERRRLADAYEALQAGCGRDRARFARRWRGIAEAWSFEELNELIRHAQRVVSGRARPADGPAHARLRPHQRPLVPPPRARRRLDPRAVPAQEHRPSRDPAGGPRTPATASGREGPTGPSSTGGLHHPGVVIALRQPVRINRPNVGRLSDRRSEDRPYLAMRQGLRQEPGRQDCWTRSRTTARRRRLTPGGRGRIGSARRHDAGERPALAYLIRHRETTTLPALGR